MANIKAIAAVSLNGGKNGDLPWRIPGELKWFKKITMGHILVMGRKHGTLCQDYFLEEKIRYYQVNQLKKMAYMSLRISIKY